MSTYFLTPTFPMTIGSVVIRIVNLTGTLNTQPDQNFTMYNGTSALVSVTVTDTGGTPVNLSNSTVNWYLERPTRPRTTPLITKTISIGTSSSNVFQFELVPSDTASRPWADYYHYAELTDSDGNVSMLFTGVLTIEYI